MKMVEFRLAKNEERGWGKIRILIRKSTVSGTSRTGGGLSTWRLSKRDRDFSYEGGKTCEELKVGILIEFTYWRMSVLAL